MTPANLPEDLRFYLQQGRDAMLRALDGLSEYDIRRPLAPSGTNLLGLVKHLSGIELGYLVTSVGREAPVLPWNEDGSVWENGDLWARAEESREYLVGLYREAWLLADAALVEIPLDAAATVPWWPQARRTTTFGHLVVRVVAETAQHAGHADILRETLDGRGGRDHDDLGDGAWWDDYVARIQAAADAHR
ncbi:MAG: DinB family protein [Dermatophilaceae bacterium]